MARNRVASVVSEGRISGSGTSPIHVMFVKLSEPISTAEINKEMTLGEFLHRRQLEYSSDIRVHKFVVGEEYILRDRDIVSCISKVSGGK